MVRRPHSSHSDRRGVAAVELALMLPVMLIFVLGSIEVCSMIFLRQALVTTSYETARVSIRSDVTTSDALARAQEVLAARGVENATVEFSPSDIGGLPRGTPLSVTVTSPATEFSTVSIIDIVNSTISSTTSMVKE